VDFNSILPILSELLSQKTFNKSEPPQQPQPEFYSPPAPNPNDTYWQLPNYSYSEPKPSQKNYNSNYKKINSCPNGQCGQKTYTNTNTYNDGYQGEYAGNYQQNQQTGYQNQGSNGYQQQGSNGYQDQQTGYQNQQSGYQNQNTSQEGYSTSKPPLDMGTLLQLLTQLAPFFPKKSTPEPAETEPESSPSYISRLPRTDRWTFE